MDLLPLVLLATVSLAGLGHASAQAWSMPGLNDLPALPGMAKDIMHSITTGAGQRWPCHPGAGGCWQSPAPVVEVVFHDDGWAAQPGCTRLSFAPSSVQARKPHWPYVARNCWHDLWLPLAACIVARQPAEEPTSWQAPFRPPEVLARTVWSAFVPGAHGAVSSTLVAGA